MIVFVTVGTTKFPELIEQVSSRNFIAHLEQIGATELLIQHGSSSCSLSESSKIRATCFDYSSSIAEHIANADLVISHAGSGTILERLHTGNGRRLVVVVNENLMDNHQIELCTKLHQLEHLQACFRVENLCDAIRECMSRTFKPYPKPDDHALLRVLDTL